MGDIFISFVHEEERVAAAVRGFLRWNLQREVFISSSPWQVFAGEDWLQRIREELEGSRVVILMLSPDSIGRAWINFEAGAAWLAGKIIIPVCFGGLTLNALPKPYSNFQAVELPGGAYYLYASIAHHFEPTTLLPQPFAPWGEELREIREALEVR